MSCIRAIGRFGYINMTKEPTGCGYLHPSDKIMNLYNETDSNTKLGLEYVAL